MGMDKIPGGGRTPVPMRHRERRVTGNFQRNLSSGEWQAIVDGPDVGMPRVKSGPYVSDTDGERVIDAALVREKLLQIGVAQGTLESIHDQQTTTLARMMVADDFRTSRFLQNSALVESGVPLGDILDDVGHLMTLGSNQWKNFFLRSGLSNANVRRFKTTAASLHCAMLYATDYANLIDSAGFGAVLHTGFMDYPLRVRLLRRFVPGMIRKKKTFTHATTKMAATAVVPGWVVAHTVRLGRPDDVAFDSYSRPNSTAAQQTLLGHRLIALASTRRVQAPRADVIIFGGTSVHKGWCEEMCGAANRADIEMRLCSIASRGAPMVTRVLG